MNDEDFPEADEHVDAGFPAAPADRVPISVVVIDDDSLVREGIVGVLERSAEVTVVGEAGSVTDALAVLRDTRPEVALIDVRLAGESGLDVLTAITCDDDLSTISCLFLTSYYDDDATIALALAHGASGFLAKSVSGVELAAALVTVAAGDLAVEPHIAVRLARSQAGVPDPTDMYATLTERERDVLHLIARGMKNGEIAEQLHLAEGTVKTYANRVFSKLDLRDRVGAVIFAYERGLVSPMA